MMYAIARSDRAIAYIIFTANALALMGLRQLYFLIEGLLEKVVYLSKGLAVILGFIGLKLVIEALHGSHVDDFGSVHLPEIGTVTSLLFIVATLIAHDRAQRAQDQPRRAPRRRSRVISARLRSLLVDRKRAEIALEVAGERRPVRVALLQERIAALDGLVGHVRQSRCLTGE